MLDRARHGVSGISRRLIASYVLVTVAVVVLVEAFVLGYQVPHLLDDAQLQAQVRGTAQNDWGQLTQRYPGGVPAGTLLGQSERHPEPGATRTKPDGTLIVPAVTGTVGNRTAVTAMVAIARDGTIIASSIPSRYPAGQPAARELPSAAAAAIEAGRRKGVPGGTGSTPYGTVSWTLYGGATGPSRASGGGQVLTYLYLQAPPPAGFVNPVLGWDELGRLAGGTPLSDITYALLIVLVPLGVGFGLLATFPLVRRVRRLERASVAVADGDYAVALGVGVAERRVRVLHDENEFSGRCGRGSPGEGGRGVVPEEPAPVLLRYGGPVSEVGTAEHKVVGCLEVRASPHQLAVADALVAQCQTERVCGHVCSFS